VDKNGAKYFSKLVPKMNKFYTFILSRKAEISSAGEQLIRNKLDG
jgi:hypothetical protein